MNTITRWWLLVNTSHVSHLYRTPRPTAVEIPFRKNSCNFRECCHSPDHNLQVTWTTQDGVLQNTAWLNYYQLSRFERVRPLCRLFVHWAAGRVLCKTMLEVSLSTGNEKHSHRITELLSNTIVECIDVFFAVSFIWTWSILINSNWIVLEFL